MVPDIIHAIMSNVDKKTLTVKLPEAFEMLKREDSNFDIFASKTIQPVKLCY